MYRWIGGVLGLLCSLTSLSSHAAPMYAQKCRALYQSKKLLAAARCFVKASRQLGTQKRVLKGRLLRNAAMLYRQAARKQSRVGLAAHHREVAIKLLQEYLDQGLFESIDRKKSAQLMQHQLNAAIGHATLTLVVNRTDVSLEIVGHEFKAKAKGTWSKRLRPGAYKITITGPGLKRPRVREIHLLPKRDRVVTLHLPAVVAPRLRVPRRRPLRRDRMGPPPRPKPKLTTRKIVSYALLISGGVLLLGGAAMVGVSVAVLDDDLRRMLKDFDEPDPNDPPLTPKFTEELLDKRDTRDAVWTAGYVLGGAGALAVVVGVVLLALPEPPARPARSSLPPSRSHRRVRLWSHE